MCIYLFNCIILYYITYILYKLYIFYKKYKFSLKLLKTLINFYHKLNVNTKANHRVIKILECWKIDWKIFFFFK